MTSNDLLARLEGVRPIVGRHPGNWIARCPAHDDKTPSLCIAETSNCTTLLHCWAGCTPEEITQAAGLALSDLFPKNNKFRPSTKRGLVINSTTALEMLRDDLLIAGIILCGEPTEQERQYLFEIAGRIHQVLERA